MSENDKTYELLAEYALGTLEPAEHAQVEALLERSETARAELRGLRAAFVGLTETLPPVTPSEHVWDGLQARLEAQSVFTARVSTTPVSNSTPTLEAPDQTALPPVVTLPRRSLQTYFGWVLAACLTVVAVGEGLWLGASRGQYREAEREAVLVADFLAAPDVERISLYGRSREGIGSVLSRADGEALFVLSDAPASGKSYQAWGHTSDNWTPGSDDLLTSLGVSDDAIFKVRAENFAALYLSLEPPGGSPQPTYPLSRVSLTEPVATAPLTLIAPASGTVTLQERVIVTGTVDGTVNRLSYVLNGETRETPLSGSRFSFTATLERGANTLTVQAHGPGGVSEETLELTRR